MMNRMSPTLLRLGLWVLVAVLAVYVLGESFEESPIAEFADASILQKGIALGVLLIAAGLVLRLFEKGAKVVVKNRCAICRTPVPHGAIYCRAHLRSILAEEDDRTHTGLSRRRNS